MPQIFPDTILYNLPKTGCDSHAHLVYPTMLPDIEEIMERADKTGIAHIGQIYLSVESYSNTRNILEKYPQIFFTIGIHPLDALTKYTNNTINELREIFKKDTRMKAVGEIGLDFFKEENPPKEVQEKIFREQLLLAKEFNLPVVIHSRNAFYETLEILDDMNFKNYPLVWHCFCGNQSQINELNERDFYISVSSSITYPANKEARADLKYIPANRLLLETDCPFLSPQGWRGERNEPCLIAVSGKVIAENRQVPLDKMWTECGENAKEVFRLA